MDWKILKPTSWIFFMNYDGLSTYVISSWGDNYNFNSFSSILSSIPSSLLIFKFISSSNLWFFIWKDSAKEKLLCTDKSSNNSDMFSFILHTMPIKLLIQYNKFFFPLPSSFSPFPSPSFFFWTDFYPSFSINFIPLHRFPNSIGWIFS